MAEFFSQKQVDKLFTCDQRLVQLCTEARKKIPFVIVCGYRGKEEQNEAFKNKKSKLQFPNSKHNHRPSLAVDLVPTNNGIISWIDRDAFRELAKVMLETAGELGIKIRWGGDWDMDGVENVKGLIDLPHYELI